MSPGYFQRHSGYLHAQKLIVNLSPALSTQKQEALLNEADKFLEIASLKIVLSQTLYLGLSNL